MLVLCGIAVWHPARCVIPPEEVEESENLPPLIDWSLTTPTKDRNVFIREKLADTLRFSIEQAVYDPEGDRIETLWFWIYDDGSARAQVGAKTHLFENNCYTDAKFESSDWIIVEVVVSDAELTWRGTGSTGDQYPVATSLDKEGNPRPAARRTWLVELQGECPPLP